MHPTTKTLLTVGAIAVAAYIVVDLTNAVEKNIEKGEGSIGDGLGQAAYFSGVLLTSVLVLALF